MRLLILFSLGALVTAISYTDLYSAFCDVATTQPKEMTGDDFGKALYPPLKDLCESLGIEINRDKFDSSLRYGAHRPKDITHEECMFEMVPSDKLRDVCKRMWSNWGEKN